MIFKGLKEKTIRKIIKKEPLPEKNVNRFQDTPLRNIGIIINYDRLQDYRPLHELAKILQISASEVFILGFVDKKYHNVNYLIPVFSRKGISFRGRVKEVEVQEFLQRDYDLLLHYYGGSIPEMQLVSRLSKAGISVGITDESQIYSDLIIKVPEGDFRAFSEELVKYLKILKRIL